jgi:hypothetical protein
MSHGTQHKPTPYLQKYLLLKVKNKIKLILIPTFYYFFLNSFLKSTLCCGICVVLWETMAVSSEDCTARGQGLSAALNFAACLKCWLET